MKAASHRRGVLGSALLVLLSAAVALEGLLVVLPHDHKTEQAPPPSVCDTSACDRTIHTHLEDAAPLVAKTSCLACAVHSVSFAGAAATRVVVAAGCAYPRLISSRPDVTRPRPWRPLLRGPPPTV
jgi:hypothetical protein